MRAAVVDELGRIEQKLLEVDLLSKRRERLREKIRSWFPPTEKPDASFTVDGQLYTVEISARESQRRITSMFELLARLGVQQFLAHASFSMTVLDSLILPADQTGLVATERTGPRRLIVTQHLREAA